MAKLTLPKQEEILSIAQYMYFNYIFWNWGNNHRIFQVSEDALGPCEINLS